MYNIILGFGALAINECQGQCHLACALKSLIGVCKSVFSKHVTVQQQIVLGLMYSALPLRRQHIYGKDEQHRKPAEFII